MRIFLVSNMYPAKNNPAYGIFVQNFEKGVRAEGWKIAARSVIKGNQKNIILKLFRYLYFYSSILWKGLFSKYDILYVHYINHTSFPILILKWIRPSIFIVANAHGSDVLPEGRVAKLIHPFSKKMATKSNILVVPSGYYQTLVEKYYPVLKNQIIVSPSSGVDSSVFYRKNDSSLKEKCIKIGFVSRINKNKGWDVFLDSIAKLIHKKNTTPLIKCIMAGDGVDQYKLRKAIKELDLQEIIDYKGFVSRQELPNLLNNLDVFVFPSRHESLGLVGLEALACGVPVIGSRIGGIQSYIEEGVNGFLFDPENSDDLVAKLEKYFLLPPDELEKMKDQSVKTASFYERSHVTKKLVANIETVFERNSSQNGKDL